MHHADHRRAVGHQRDRDADDGEPVQEVRGAVERIDEPPDVGRARRPPPRRRPGCRARRRAARPRTTRSLAVSASLTQSPGAFARTLRAAPNASSTIAATGARPRRRAARAARRGRGRRHSATAAIEPSSELRRARRRPAGGARRGRSTTSSRSCSVARPGAGLRAHEQPAEVVPRRVPVGQPSSIAVEPARRRRRTARAPPTRARGTAAIAQHRRGMPESATTASSTRVVGAGATATPSRYGALAAHRGDALAGRRRSRPARTAARRRRARTARSPSTGCSREQLVEPSTGSTTTVIVGVAGPVQPDSSLTTADRRGVQHRRATAASATRSSAYWPGRSVRARRALPPTSGTSASRCASAAASNSASSSSGVHREASCGEIDALGMRIDVEAVAAEEARRR